MLALWAQGIAGASKGELPFGLQLRMLPLIAQAFALNILCIGSSVALGDLGFGALAIYLLGAYWPKLA